MVSNVIRVELHSLILENRRQIHEIKKHSNVVIEEISGHDYYLYYRNPFWTWKVETYISDFDPLKAKKFRASRIRGVIKKFEHLLCNFLTKY